MLIPNQAANLSDTTAAFTPVTCAIHVQHGAPSAAETRRTRGINTQPIEAAMLPGALLKMQTVVSVTGLSVATIYRKLAAGKFVEPIRLGTRCTRFRAGDVMRWLEAQGASSAD